MLAFTDAEAVAKRLKRDFSSEEAEWVEELLVDASAYLRAEAGQNIWPVTTSTFTDWPDAGRVDLPQHPVHSVDAVRRGGVDIPFTHRPGYITVTGDDPVDITFTWGFPVAPDLIVSYCAVLVSQAILTVETGTGLTFGGLSSLALDDFRAAFSNGGAESGMTLPKPQLDLLRRTFGTGNVTVVETR